ncbi:MAG: hypothetical protein A2X86_13350 [Bdellovibrionales bacterium GWA2_49_15]|nr:MAG: hypothetical protein A2X86_13350 [Bdellovibrionales bacterium GWA2_49_15]HAZ13511.1 hypothetical protein [Bdellovibrionales bacterium]
MKFSVLCFVILFAALAKAADYSLSPNWQGVWKGQCQLLNSDSRPPDPISPFRMEMHIKELAKNPLRYQWQIIYGMGATRQVRPYELYYDKQKEHFVLDEKNGIFLDTFYRAAEATLYSGFIVDGKYLQTEEVLIQGRLRVRIYSFAQARLTLSRPEVHTFEQASLQECWLSK